MAQFSPFRSPVNTEDSPDDWTPPDYAVPIDDSSNEWKPPSYAKPIEAKTEEKPKPSVFSRASGVVSDISKNLRRDFGEAKTQASEFLKEHPKATEVAKRLLLGQEEDSSGHKIAGPGLMKVPGVEELGNKIRDYGRNSGNYWGGAASSIIGDLVSGSAVGFDPRASGPQSELGAAEELPIRQSREVPYKMEKVIKEPPKVEEPIKSEEAAKPFINPFEKKVEETSVEESQVKQPVNLPPDLVPVGEEDIFNKSRPEDTTTRDVQEAAYENVKRKFNMGMDKPEEWKPPSYAKAVEEPQAARTESGKLAIGADIKSLGKVLGTSLYKGDIAPIATKELLQNSIDAVRHLGSEGKIDVILDHKNNIIHVSDNGKGLSRGELESVFTDLGSSGKREDTSAAGGFGLAKAAPLLGGKKVEVSTITEGADGRFHEYSFSGTPTELLEGVDIKHRIIEPELPSKVNPVVEKIKTGTTVKVHVPEGSDFYQSEKFVKNLSEHSPNVQSQIRFGENYSRDEYDQEDILKPLAKGKGKSLVTLNNPSATTELIIPESSEKATRSSITLNLSNNGMYQGRKEMYFNSEVPNVPKSVTVDIRSKVPEGHADYPFTANREELRGTVQKQVEEYINENIVKPGVGKRVDELKRLYESMQEITVGKGEFPNSFGHKISLYDPKGQITPSEMKSITSNSAFQTLAGNIAGTLKEAMKVAGTPEWSDRLEKIGIIFEDKLHGVHIPNPGSKKSAILVNPFVAIRDMSPDEASANILHTILHEMAHVEPSGVGHNESFTVRLGDIYAKFGARRSVEAQDQILNSIADKNTGIYNNEIQEVLSTYKASRGREATTEDLLSGTGIRSRVKGGGEGDIPPNDKSNGEGVVRGAVDKLFSALKDVKVKVGEQEALNKTERARRFAAFEGVKQEGAVGAAKSLGKLRGEFEKVNPGERLELNQNETDSLFTAIKNANITTGEKARGYTALFKVLNGEKIPQRNELGILDNVFGYGFADKIINLHGGIGAVGIKLSKLANTMKSMQNSISLAAPLRHGIGLATRKEFYPAFADMFKFFGNKEYYNTAMQAIEERPNYLLGRESGLFIAKPGSLQNSEEEFLNSYVGSLPKFTGIPQTVGASQRAYVGFLNKLRSDTFDSMVKQAESLGYKSSTQVGDQMIPTKEAKAIANYINNATGRGSLGSLNKMTNELNLLLWSPRMISSRINMLANPKIYTDLPKGMRLDGLKSLLGIAALGTTIDTLAAYGGAKVSNNILSSDAAKARFGTHVIDPWGGFQQYVVAAARFLAGKTDSSSYPPVSRLDIAGRFAASKESPAASLAHTILTSKFTGKSDDPATAGNMTTQYGEKTNIQSQIGKQFIPIFIQDLHDLLTSEPEFSNSIGLDTALAGASLAGMAQDYPEKKGKLQLRKLR